MCFRQIITYTCNHERIAEDTRCPFFSHQFGCQNPMRKPLRDAFSSSAYCVSRLPFLCEKCKKKKFKEERRDYRMKVKPGYYGYPKLEGKFEARQKEVGSSGGGEETWRESGKSKSEVMSENWSNEEWSGGNGEIETNHGVYNKLSYQVANPGKPILAQYIQADLNTGQEYQQTILNNPNMTVVEDVVVREAAAPGVRLYRSAQDEVFEEGNEQTEGKESEIDGELIDFDE